MVNNLQPLTDEQLHAIIKAHVDEYLKYVYDTPFSPQALIELRLGIYAGMKMMNEITHDMIAILESKGQLNNEEVGSTLMNRVMETIKVRALELNKQRLDLSKRNGD